VHPPRQSSTLPYGEGLETDGGSHFAPRQSLTRQLFFRNWKGAVRLAEVRRLEHPVSLQVAITASMLAAVLARDISAGLEQIAQHDALESSAFPP
jgi:hypothetical protein